MIQKVHLTDFQRLFDISSGVNQGFQRQRDLEQIVNVFARDFAREARILQGLLQKHGVGDLMDQRNEFSEDKQA